MFIRTDLTCDGFLNAPCNATLRRLSLQRENLTDDLFRCALVTFPNTKCFELLGCEEESEINLAEIIFSNPELIVKCWKKNKYIYARNSEGKIYAHPNLEVGKMEEFFDNADFYKTVDEHLVVVNFDQPNLPDQEENLNTALSFDNNYNQANVSEVLSRNEAKHLCDLVLCGKSVALLPKFDSWRLDNLLLRSCQLFYNSTTRLISEFARKEIAISVDQLHLEWTRLSPEIFTTFFSNQ
jgi:hypothetical protein